MADAAATRSGIGVLVVADTHLTGHRLDRMPPEVWELAEEADVVLHAGDVLDQAVLDAFATRAELHAVLGNNDHALAGRLPTEVRVELGGVRIAMVHETGPSAGRERRVHRMFPEDHVVVFGHSHQPLVHRSDRGQLLVNPGSPTQRRRQPVHTVAWLELRDGDVVRADIVEVGPEVNPRRRPAGRG
ncbi:MAG: metallophosphoesterase family protein [Actinobacteria bacterium]|nr:metallophosphoesterase family protein [Actinomycetota bacterium]